MPARSPSDLKIVVLGAGGVGKSALTIRFVEGNFIEQYDPTIEDSYSKTVELSVGENETRRVNLEILDTAGTDQFAAMRELYMASGDVFILVYSVCSAATFHDLTALHDALAERRGAEVPLVLVGNKCDLMADRVISKGQGEALAKSWGCAFYETSALKDVNVTEAFLHHPKLVVQAGKDKPKKKPKACIVQ